MPLLPEEGGIRPLDHLKLAELLHGVNLLRGLVTNLQQRGGGEGWGWGSGSGCSNAHSDNAPRTIGRGLLERHGDHDNRARLRREAGIVVHARKKTKKKGHAYTRF